MQYNKSQRQICWIWESYLGSPNSYIVTISSIMDKYAFYCSGSDINCNDGHTLFCWIYLLLVYIICTVWNKLYSQTKFVQWIFGRAKKFQPHILVSNERKFYKNHNTKKVFVFFITKIISPSDCCLQTWKSKVNI